jgi:uncharacterized protein YeaO (DUF488 family)
MLDQLPDEAKAVVELVTEIATTFRRSPKKWNEFRLAQLEELNKSEGNTDEEDDGKLCSNSIL